MPEHTGLSEFREKFRVEELTVLTSATWTWSVRPLQTTVGAGVLSVNRYVEHFGDLSPAEGADLASMVQVVERALNTTFGNDKINYLMLMMVDPHVHFHVIPRYGREVEFAGHSWIDSGWPTPPNLSDNQELSNDQTLAAVRVALHAAARQR